jgi:hypothetical protein
MWFRRSPYEYPIPVVQSASRLVGTKNNVKWRVLPSYLLIQPAHL